MKKLDPEERVGIIAGFVLTGIGFLLLSYQIGHGVGYNHGMRDAAVMYQEQFNEYHSQVKEILSGLNNINTELEDMVEDLQN